MKNIYIIIAYTILIPFNAFTQNAWNVTNNLFSYNKLEKDLSYYYFGTASVVFEGKIFYFATYAADENLMVVREVSNVPDGTDFTPDEDEHYEILKNKLELYSKPAPVVFDGKLYLFFEYKTGFVAYVTYQGDQVWSDPVIYPESKNLHLDYGAAVQIGDNLCLATYSDKENLQMNWTTDPTNPDGWSSHKFAMDNELSRDHYFYGGISTYVNRGISLIAQTYREGTVVTQKLMLANINSLGHAQVAQFKFNSSGQLDLLRNDIIESELTFQSVALAQGSVENDPSSIGNCTQLFVKNAKTDNKYYRYRILRYQLKEGESAWTLAESNLVPQNDPIKMWGDGLTDITAVNYDMLDKTQNNSSIQRYIALLYRGDNDKNCPLLCAWAKSDYLKYSREHVKDFQNDMAHRQYIGFFEGPPPFFLNGGTAPSFDNGPNKISSLEFTHKVSAVVEKSNTYESTHKITAHVPHLSSEISLIRSENTKYKTTVTSTFGHTENPGPESLGHYLFQAPKIIMTEYSVYDWKKGTNKDTLYPTFYFYMEEKLYFEEDTLKNSLNSSDPQTFMNMNRKIDFRGYESVLGSGVEAPSVSWSKQGEDCKSVEIEQDSSLSSTNKKSWKLSSEFSKYFGSEMEKSIEYETTTTTSTSNELTACTRLNDPVGPLELKRLNYDVYWIKYTEGQPNWWIKDSTYKEQETWCITYKVTSMTFNNDSLISDTTSWGAYLPHTHETSLITDSISVKKIEDINLQPGTSPLKQNNPNPFIGSTKIKYTVGIENMPANSTDCLTRLVIYNLSGQQVATLVNENKAPGTYEVEWDASQFTPGVYFYSLQSGSFKDVKKLILMK
jgi:hypothetical protein